MLFKPDLTVKYVNIIYSREILRDLQSSNILTSCVLYDDGGCFPNMYMTISGYEPIIFNKDNKKFPFRLSNDERRRVIRVIYKKKSGSESKDL